VIGAIAWTAIAVAQQPDASAPGGLPRRATTAVTYEARRTTKIDLMGTPLMPRARGEAEIETESAGPVRIKAKVRDLAPASGLGAEYLTFVAWAIPPQGRAKNLGELRLDDGAAEIEVTSDVQTFALVVTAEPYYAVTTPSDVVVMENAVRADTRGHTSLARLQYEIVPRGGYIADAGGRYSTPPSDRRDPPDVQQARNAVKIAEIAEAPRLAPESFATAQRLLAQTEQLVARRESSRDVISQSRAAVQAAEEARLQAAVRRVAEDAAAADAAAAERERAARAQAEQEATARRTAEARAQEAAQDRERAAAAQLAAETERTRAERLAQDAQQERQHAEEARRAAEQARSEAETHAARADALRASAEQDRATLRATLLQQFSGILETRDTARGLIVNVGDVLFETGRYDLRPQAREKLARFAGIVLAHSGLAVQAEGFTDSTGSVTTNERLSQQRADAVGQYLIAQGLPTDRITTRGYGAAHPIASNDSHEGRQKNRRVELIVSGDVIGTPIGAER